MKQVIYAFLEQEEYETIVQALPSFDGILIPIQCKDWNKDLSPWYAKRVFPNGDDFWGGADEFLKKLTEEIIPEKESKMVTVPEKRFLVGYSLAGLFSLYAGTRTDLFAGIASVSGSLWFDGFIEYLEKNSMSHAVDKIYLSVGSKEKNAKNERMKRVEESTKITESILKDQNIATKFELNPGGHFLNVQERIIKGIQWLLNDNK